MIKHTEGIGKTHHFQEGKGKKRRVCYVSLNDCYAPLFSHKNSLLQSARGYLFTTNAIKSGHVWKNGKTSWSPVLGISCNCNSFRSSSFLTWHVQVHTHMQCLQQNLGAAHRGSPEHRAVPWKSCREAGEPKLSPLKSLPFIFLWWHSVAWGHQGWGWYQDADYQTVQTSQPTAGTQQLRCWGGSHWLLVASPCKQGFKQFTCNFLKSNFCITSSLSFQEIVNFHWSSFFFFFNCP